MDDIHDKFPPKRKEEFLKWVMLTQPKDEWSDVVCGYMDHHQIKNWSVGLNFIIKWTGTPSYVAYYMVVRGFAEPEWAMKVIENAKTGDPSYVAYLMVRYGLAEPQWAMKVIENAKTGTPSHFAYRMVRDELTKDTDWVMRVIGNAKTGDPSHFAYRMVRDGYATQEWAMKVIENDKTGNPSYAVYWMVRNGHATQEWFNEYFGQWHYSMNSKAVK